jgi:hypothetical protein
VSYEVEYTNDFETWWFDLSEAEQVSITAVVGLLAQEGPLLRFPHTSGIVGSKHGHMRELRVQHAGDPYRVFYAFDPRRVGILLIGGCKVGDDRFYETMIAHADRIYDEHLKDIEKEPKPDR